MRLIYPSRKNQRQQHGAILVQFALLAMVLLAILGTLQIGYMYAGKRDLQRIADIAALESANAILLPTSCSDAKIAGKQSIDAQMPLGIETQGDRLDMVECGNWSKTAGFTASSPYNAARVTVSGQSLQLVPFTGDRKITATATAAIANESVASFSVGSGVARLEGGVLNNLLTLLLGTSVNLSLVDYEGLANTQVNLLGITDALQVNAGTYSELLKAKVSLKELLNASITVAENLPDQATANVAIDALDQLLKLPVALDLDNTFIHLLKGEGRPGLLELGLYNNSPASALQADVSILNVLTTALQIANAESAVALQTTVDLGILAKATVAVKVIEPPVIATGRAGTDETGKYYTTAHTGQVRVKIELKALNALNASGDLLDINLILLRLRVSLPSNAAIEIPVNIEVGSATARLENIACNFYEKNKHKVSIGAKPGVAQIFLGKVPEAFTNTSQSWENLAKSPFNLLDINIKATLLADLIQVINAPIKVTAKLDIPVRVEKYQTLDFKYASDLPRSQQDLTQSSDLGSDLGASIGNAIGKNLLDIELDTAGLSLLGINADFLSTILDGLVKNLLFIVKGVLSLLSNLLNPILELLDSILGPLLKALGLQIGYADVELIWADCNPAQLVN